MMRNASPLHVHVWASHPSSHAWRNVLLFRSTRPLTVIIVMQPSALDCVQSAAASVASRGAENTDLENAGPKFNVTLRPYIKSPSLHNISFVSHIVVFFLVFFYSKVSYKV